MRYVCVSLIAFAPLFAHAQESNVIPEDPRLPNSLSPGISPSERISRPSFFEPYRNHRKKSDGPTVETYEQYVARMKRTVKAIRKYDKLMRKPQYSNPMYFGHKRKPKKHKAGKLKFCKECGIRH
jgi:hypothetical protein